ncbi:Aste57867_4342 [Aphanomyces stellatus]|uniref:Aste57867_4342 protein n=1 Tax=Aphanomyces stellatus TaxID=120398 RepID=A0A485KCX8_9STRA|nr:hypothetical protein As57867_004330 [Aphanomyces stellatus]VFT81456.1 Aste57867_4342 [Aphanomyces stellatus]
MQPISRLRAAFYSLLVLGSFASVLVVVVYDITGVISVNEALFGFENDQTGTYEYDAYTIPRYITQYIGNPTRTLIEVQAAVATTQRILYIEPNATDETDYFIIAGNCSSLGGYQDTDLLYTDWYMLPMLQRILLMDASFRKTFVFSCRKRLSRNGIVAALHDEIRPRIGQSSSGLNELVELTTFIDKSLRKGESMICTIHPASKILDFHFKGFSHPSLLAPGLCRCLQGLFFDANSIQTMAKRGLIARIPLLWGQQASVAVEAETAACRPSHAAAACDADDADDDDDDDDDEDAEQEARRRESTRFAIHHFGAMVDPDSNQVFPGVLADGMVLLGTRASKSDALRHCTVGLYVDPAAATEHLLRFKGLSFGSVESDPDFLVGFTTGAFRKCLRMVLTETTSVLAMAQLLATRLRQSHCLQDTTPVMDLFPTLPAQLGKDEALLLLIHADGSFQVRIDGKAPTTTAAAPHGHHDLGTAVQSLFYGYHAPDVSSRAQLMQRLPILLDHAKADLVHTYHDEIVMLKENYKRLTPANRIKVGYMMLYRRRAMLPKWSRRWCRLDGVVLSIFGHKNKTRPKEVVVLSRCTIKDLSSHDEMLVELRKLDHITLVVGITPPDDVHGGEMIVLRAENVAEGTEWVEALTEASQLPVKQFTPNGGMSSSSADDIQTDVDPMRRAATDTFDDEDDDDEDIVDEVAVEVAKPAVYMSGGGDDAVTAETDREVVGSLVQWLCDDIRNQLIVLLFSALVWSVGDVL